MEKETVRILGTKHAIPALDFIKSNGPVRFRDLELIVENQTMRANTLKLLRKEGLITDCLIEEKDRRIKVYKLTTKGRKILKKASEIEKLL